MIPLRRLLIVDDEDLELHGLVAMLGTFDLPLEVCGMARNGKEGLQKAHECGADIVLTDLRMPQMNGIEMIRALKRELPDTKVILISGFEDFAAAREAIELGALAYLLKPVNRRELYTALQKCHLFEGYAPLPTARQTPGTRVSLYSYQEERLVRQCLFGATDEPPQAMDMCIFAAKKLLAVVAVKLNLDNSCDMLTCFEQLQYYAKQMNAVAPILVEENKAVVIFGTPAFADEESFTDDLSQNAEELVALFAEMGVYDVTIGISEISDDPHRLGALYLQSQSALDEHFYDGLSQVIFYENKQETARYFYKTEYNDQPVNLIVTADEKGLIDYLRDYFETIGSYSSQEEIRNHCMEMVSATIQALRKVSPAFESRIDAQGLPYTKLVQSKTLSEMQSYATEYLCGLLTVALKLSEDYSTKIIMRMHDIIGREFATPLTIDYIASKLYLSPSHIRRLFKNKTGLTIMDYLENVRMDKACSLLAEPQYRIHEIGGMVGYENASYFNIVFKKHFNMTPGEYRKTVVEAGPRSTDEE